MSTENKTPLKAYEILYSFVIKQPGSISVPARTPDEAVKKLGDILGEGVSDIKIESVTDVEEIPTFKKMIAAQVLSVEREQAAFERWLKSAEEDDKEAAAIEDAEIINETKKIIH